MLNRMGWLSLATKNNHLTDLTVKTFEEVVDDCWKFITQSERISNTPSDDILQERCRLIDNFVTTVNSAIDGYMLNGVLETRKLKQSLIDTITGYSLLQAAIDDDSIIEIVGNNYRSIFVNRGGIAVPYVDPVTGEPIRFPSNNALLVVINRLLSYAHLQIDAGLHRTIGISTTPEKYRVSAIGAGAIVTNSTIVGESCSFLIRKHPTTAISPEQLIQWHSISKEAYQFLKIVAEYGGSVVIAGDTGTGKSTYLQCLCDSIPAEERTFVFEPASELKCCHYDNEGNLTNNVVQMQYNVDLQGTHATEATLSNLINVALTMSASTFVFGEIKYNDEIAVMLKGIESVSTFHCTTHASSPASVVSKFANARISSGGVSYSEAVASICDKIDVIILPVIEKVSNNNNRRKRIYSIYEVEGADFVDGRISPVFRELYRFIDDPTDEVYGGKLYQVNSISENLFHKLTYRGMPEKTKRLLNRKLDPNNPIAGTYGEG